jgi:hypothetical protein
MPSRQVSPFTSALARIDPNSADKRIGSTEGLDKVLDDYGLDALIMPTTEIAHGYPAIVG